jgi:hypothetical protein
MMKTMQRPTNEGQIRAAAGENTKYVTKDILKRLNRIAIVRGYSRSINNTEIEQSQNNTFALYGYSHVTVRGTVCVRCRVRLDHALANDGWLDLPVDSFLALPDAN